MAKKLITIKQYASELVYDVRSKAFLTGRSRSTGDNAEKVAYMQVSEDEEENNQILRSIGNALGDLHSKLGEYLNLDISSDDNALIDGQEDIVLAFDMPTNFNCTAVKALTSGIHQYLVNSALAEWFTITNKEDAKEYISMSAANIVQIRKALGRRSRPVRTSNRPTYRSLFKKANYLYDLTYDTIDYDFANEYFKTKAPALNGGCSCIRKDGLIGRNYDWLDNYDAVFALHTPATQGFHAVLGVAGSLMTVQEVDSHEMTDDYKLLPFYLQDGGNDKGLFAEINVVPTTGETRTVPTISKRESVCSLMLVRYILDRFESVDDAVEYITRYVEVYQPTSLSAQGFEPHFLLADASKTVVLEFIGNTIKTVESDISTNFHLWGVTPLADGSVYTNDDVPEGHLPSSLGIEDYGSGLERWNILNAAEITDRETMRDAMRSVRFSKAYTDTERIWHSEFVGAGISVDTLPTDEDFISRIEHYRSLFAVRSKDNPQVWISTHTSIYNLENRCLYVSVQEQDTEYKFNL